MPLPPKLFYPICEIANRWSVSAIDIVGWAIDGRISLSAALPLIEVKRSRLIEGLAEIAGQDVFDLFAAGHKNKSAVQIHRFRQRPGARWERILNPTEGVPLKASGVLIARIEAERFEREHQLFGQHQPQPIEPATVATAPAGAPSRYDWNGFAGAVARRTDHPVVHRGDRHREREHQQRHQEVGVVVEELARLQHRHRGEPRRREGEIGRAHV